MTEAGSKPRISQYNNPRRPIKGSGWQYYRLKYRDLRNAPAMSLNFPSRKICIFVNYGPL